MSTSKYQAIAFMRSFIAASHPTSRFLQGVLLSAFLAGTAGALEKRPTAVLSLDDGGFAAGDLADSDRPGVLRWQAAGFVAPFEFKLGRVNAVHWTPDEKAVKPEGEFCFELGGGDVVFGSLANLDLREGGDRCSSNRPVAGAPVGDSPDLPVAGERRLGLSGPERAFGLE